MVVLCHSQEQAAHVKAKLAEWLAPRGLAFNEDKTKIVHLGEGFDFLGFNIRRYHRKLLIKPSKAAIRRLRERLAAETRTLRGSNAVAVIAALNPVIRGWAAYYRGSGVIRGVQLAGQLHVEAHLQVGHMAPQEQAETLDRRPVLRQVQHVQERPAGYSATATAAATWSSSPGPASNGTCRSRARHLPMTPPWPATGPNGGEKQAAAGQIHPAPARQAGRALPAMRGPPAHRRPATPVPRAMGTVVAAGHPQGDSRQLPRPPRATRLSRTMTKPASCTPPASAGSTPACAGNQHFNLQRPRGLLEPYAATSGSYGSEGARARRHSRDNHRRRGYCGLGAEHR